MKKIAFATSVAVLLLAAALWTSCGSRFGGAPAAAPPTFDQSPSSTADDSAGLRRRMEPQARRSAPEQLRALGYSGGLEQEALGAASSGGRPVVALRPGEELWVIARAASVDSARAPDSAPSPELRARVPDRSEEIPLPLVHTDVVAQVSAFVASVRVQQQYYNPYDGKIEAVYVFPLPQNAAVSDFVMTIGNRRIRGVVREREEAEQIYADARAQGHVASLLTEERPNIFTQSVANIEPGHAIDIDLTYFNVLAQRDGEFELVFPMVVGPRFNPPGTRDGIGSTVHGASGSSGQDVEVQYLPPDRKSGHRIDISVDIDAGMRIDAISSPTHAIRKRAMSPNRTIVDLADADRIPDRDFVLRYRLAGERAKTAFLHYPHGEGGYFALMLQPPADLEERDRSPMELVFVLDCSGSMSGEPLAASKEAVKRALRRLTPNDTFQIITFSSSASQLGAVPIPATEDNVRRGLAYVDELSSEGGTMMVEGIKAALDFPHDPRRLRIVTFMTDGFIGNEVEILGEVHRRLGAARIFSFGVGSAPNRYLLESMAKIGRGAVAYVGGDEGSMDAVDAFYERVSHPAMTDLVIDWGDASVSDVYPESIPDLFVGRPTLVLGRYEGAPPSRVEVRGRVRGERQSLWVDADDGSPRHAALSRVWARSKISDLSDRATYEDSAKLDEEIMTVALEYGIMSALTAFVAVDSSVVTSGSQGTTVPVPVPVPEGVRYDTAVGGR